VVFVYVFYKRFVNWSDKTHQVLRDNQRVFVLLFCIIHHNLPFVVIY